MARVERCLTGLLAALVLIMIAAALRSPGPGQPIARAVVDLPAPIPLADHKALSVPMVAALAGILDAMHLEAISPLQTVSLGKPTSEAVRTEALDESPPGAAGPIAEERTDGGTKAAEAGISGRPSAHHLSEAFDNLGYDLKSVGGGERVPRLFLTNVPVDMGSIRHVQRRKTVFLQTVLPLILQVNEEIAQERRLLWRLRYKTGLGIHLRAAERLWLKGMTERYGVDDGDIDMLLRKVDIIPPSLALAQAAEESGWGTSRLARESNALFGEGVIQDGKVQQIRTFDSLLDAVRGYARNLNAHGAYRDFRNARRIMRQRGKPLDGHALAGFILRYSERGEDYIKTLRVIIAVNDLRELDGAELHGELTADNEMTAEPAI